MSAPRRSGPSDKITFSVRLSAGEHERLQALAAAAGVDASTLLRSWISQGRAHASPGPAPLPRGYALPSASQPRQIPRWWLLPPRLYAMAKAVEEACAARPAGVVLLEEVIYAVRDAGVMDEKDASDRMWELTGKGWIAQQLPEGDVDESYMGKTAFHGVWGALSSSALSMVSFEGEEGRSGRAGLSLSDAPPQRRLGCPPAPSTSTSCADPFGGRGRAGTRRASAPRVDRFRRARQGWRHLPAREERCARGCRGTSEGSRLMRWTAQD